MTSIWTTLNRYPPYVVRLLARTVGKHPVALPDSAISAASGIDLPMLRWIYNQTSWNEVPVDLMRRFVKACNVDFGNAVRMKSIAFYCRSRHKNKWTYLKSSPEWEATFRPLLELWRKEVGK